MGDIVDIIKLIIAFSLTGAFVFTLTVTCLSMINVVKSIDAKLRKALIKVLILEVSVIAVGSFADLLRFNPFAVAERLRQSERDAIVLQVSQYISPEKELSDLEIYNPESRARLLTALSIMNMVSSGDSRNEADSLINNINLFARVVVTSADSAIYAEKIRVGLAELEERAMARNMDERVQKKREF